MCWGMVHNYILSCGWQALCVLAPWGERAPVDTSFRSYITHPRLTALCFHWDYLNASELEGSPTSCKSHQNIPVFTKDRAHYRWKIYLDKLQSTLLVHVIWLTQLIYCQSFFYSIGLKQSFPWPFSCGRITDKKIDQLPRKKAARYTSPQNICVKQVA